MAAQVARADARRQPLAAGRAVAMDRPNIIAEDLIPAIVSDRTLASHEPALPSSCGAPTMICMPPCAPWSAMGC